MQRRLARMGVWKSDMVGCGLAGKRGEGGRKGMWQGQRRAIFTSICQPPAAGNEIGDPGVKHLSLVLAKCPNLHTLNFSGQWVTYRLSAVRWEARFGRGMCTDRGRIRMTDRDTDR